MKITRIGIKERMKVEEVLKNFRTSEYYDDRYEWLYHNLKELDKFMVCINEHDDVIDIIYKEEDKIYYKNHGIDVFYPYFWNDVNKEELDALYKLYPKCIVGLNDYTCFDFEANGYEVLKAPSSFNVKMEYSFGSTTYFCKKGYLPKNILTEYFEDLCFHKCKTSELTFRVLSSEELNKFLSLQRNPFFEIPTWQEYGNHSYAGFHYFSTNYSEHNNYYLVALNLDEEIVGVIKYGLYGTPRTHLGLNYIDVRCDMKQKGVATALIKEFAKVVDSKYTLILSNESEMGRKCHMASKFKSEFKRTRPSMKVLLSSEIYSDAMI